MTEADGAVIKLMMGVTAGVGLVLVSTDYTIGSDVPLSVLDGPRRTIIDYMNDHLQPTGNPPRALKRSKIETDKLASG